MSKKLLRITRRGLRRNTCLEVVFVLLTFETDVTKRSTTFFCYKREEENAYLLNDENWFKMFERIEDLTHIKPKILKAISQMIENDRVDGKLQIREIVVPRKPHSLCKMNQNAVSNGQAARETGVFQAELKQKISALDKNSKVMKTFEDNKCSICLSNYKEILDEDLHILVASCGHPLCCICAENILDSKNEECPQCREKITDQSFNLMKFNADLTIDTENQRVFL